MESLEQVEEFKKEGNELYKKGVMFAKHTLGKNSMVEACSKYALGLDMIKRMEEQDPEVCADGKGKELLISLYLNLAAAGLALDSHDSALNCCNAVLQLDPKHAKALYRRAKVHSGLKDYEKALEDLKTAVQLCPGNKDLRKEYTVVKKLYDKQLDAEAFHRATNEGRNRLESDEKEGSCLETTTITMAWIKSNELEPYIRNGAIVDSCGYAWGQSLYDVHILVKVDKDVGAKDVECTFKRTGVDLKVKDRNVFAESDKKFRFPITVDESTWELETPGCIHITIRKEAASQPEKKTNGKEWWDCVFQNDPTIILEDCNVGTDLRELPADKKVEMEKLMTEQARMTPEQLKEVKERQEVGMKMKAEHEETQSRNEKIMQDSSTKKAIYEMMKEKFPDIPVELR